MTDVRARCDSCTVVFPVRAERAVVALPDPSEGAPDAEVLCTCGECGTPTVGWVPRIVALLLVHRGAAALPRPRPTALAYPERRPRSTSPLSTDDLLALHELLARPDWPAALTEQPDAGSEPG